jgi:hypothetical protein
VRVLRLGRQEHIAKRRTSHRSRTRCNHQWRTSVNRYRIGLLVPCVPVIFQIVDDKSLYHSLTFFSEKLD